MTVTGKALSARAAAERVVRRVADGDASAEEVELVVMTVVEELLLRDYEGTLAMLDLCR